MRCLYFDCFSGASGDMIVGALIDLGVPLGQLEAELSKLGLTEYSLGARRVLRSHISGTKFDVNLHSVEKSDHHGDHHHHEKGAGAHQHRSLSTIEKLIDSSTLAPQVQDRARRVFRRLGEAEAAIHNIPIEDVIFHEVGAIDSIVDIVGACIGFEILKIERFQASALNVGFGMVQTAHGNLPVPAPATARLLEDAPVYSREGNPGELVTPTGAAIIATLCDRFGPLPEMTIRRTGFGAGSRDLENQPNFVRLILGEIEEPNDSRHSAGHGDVLVIETNIDDMNPQVFGYLMDKALAAGALDIYYTPVQMKKNRPGVLLTVLCEEDRLDELADLIFRETTTIGMRLHTTRRRVLMRERVEVETIYGPINVKIARQNSKVMNYSAEYDDCRAAAECAGVALREVQTAAQLAFEDWLKAKDLEQ